MRTLKTIVKFGKSPKGKQKYYNKETGKFFTEDPEPRKSVSQETKDEAVSLYLDGTCVRAVARCFKVSHVSVLKWIEKAALSLSETEQQTEYQDVQLDEMWHFTKKKIKNSGCGLLSTRRRTTPSGSTSGSETIKPC